MSSPVLGSSNNTCTWLIPYEPLKFALIPGNILSSTGSSSKNDTVARLERLVKTEFNQLTFAQFQEIRSIKKLAKKSPDLDQISKKTILTEYDNFIAKHSVLKELQSMSRGMRAIKTEQELNTAFPWGVSELPSQYKETNSAWNRYYFLVNKLGGITHLHQDLHGKKELWTSLRQRIFEAAQEVAIRAPKLLEKPFTWIHGSCSGALPSMFKMKITNVAPSLIPTGILLQHNFAPLTGEVDMGISERGINQHSLSGVTSSYLDTALQYTTLQFLFDAEKAYTKLMGEKEISIELFNTVKVNVLRLLLMKLPQEKKELLKKHFVTLRDAYPARTSEILPDWREAVALLAAPKSKMAHFEKAEKIGIGSAAFVHRSIGEPTLAIVIRETDDEFIVRLSREEARLKKLSKQSIDAVSIKSLKEANKDLIAPSQDELEIIEDSMRTEREKLDRLLMLFDTIKPLEFDESDLAFFNKPFPLIVASNSLTLEQLVGVKGDVPGEAAVRGPQKLGRDIQVFFVPRENVMQADSYVQKNLAATAERVLVLSIDAMHYLFAKTATHFMVKGRPCYDNR